jgi:L-lactate dehydrogenase (cytochrome)
VRPYRPKALKNCHSILDLRELARHKLPDAIFDVMEGAGETEVTAQRNVAAFDERKLIPRCLVDVDGVNTATRIMGQDIDWPVYCSPTGFTRLFHPGGELAVARAAARAGTIYGLSTASTFTIEDVAAASDGLKIFQLYICRNPDLTRSLIERSKQCGYVGLCITVDTPVVGKYERDLRNGIFDPPSQWPLSTIMGFARHPSWALKQLGAGPIFPANFSGPDDAPAPPELFYEELNPSITWKDIREIADLWGGPLVLKGVLSPDDARRAADAGATGVIVSNHGGRQSDGALASIEALPEIVRAVGDRLEVIFDGGIRRGVHVVKALALGAKACAVGRPYLYGLGAGGEAGVTKALDILRTELVLAMKLTGCASLADIDESLIWKS